MSTHRSNSDLRSEVFVLDGNKRWAIAACWLAACSQDVDTGRRCQAGDDACYASTHGAQAGRAIEGGGGTGATGGAAASGAPVGHHDDALKVHVEDIDAMTIEVVTLACAGDCADIEAVAHGGNPPYAFRWEDGSTAAQRHVCLDADAKLSISATDTAIADEEFQYDAETVRADVTAHVLGCAPDAGTPPDTTCTFFENPSFEGRPQANVTGAEFDAPPWQPCDLTPDLTSRDNASGTGGQVASDGETYVYLGVATAIGSESIAQKLCSPLRAGQVVYVKVDLQPFVPYVGTQLHFYGASASACAEEELIGKTGVVTAMDTWTTECVALIATTDTAFVKLTMEPGLGGGLIDNLVVVDACP